MFDNIENLKIISATQGISSKYHEVKSKKISSFILRTSGSVCYTFPDKTIMAKEKDIIFLPAGSSYTILSNGQCGYVSISFQADIENTKPVLYSLEDFTETDYIISHFCELWNLGTQADKYKCIALFYELLSHISGIENQKYANKKKFDIIAPGVKHLKSHIYDSELNVEKLYILCGISDTYFRKIFISQFGVSPSKYIINKRISQAKAIIDNGNFNSVGEIANSVGFTDPLYFSRVFKKKYGISPLNMIKE